MTQNENVKIKINEVDNTTPNGAPTDSSDIVFIPGLMGFSSFEEAKGFYETEEDFNKAFNVPTLFTTVEEFEKKIGKKPHIFTANEVTDAFSAFGAVEGDYDKSYVYAKELLYAGMPVIYSAISNTKTTTTEITYDYKKFTFNDVIDEEVFDKYVGDTAVIIKAANGDNLSFTSVDSAGASLAYTYLQLIGTTATEDSYYSINYSSSKRYQNGAWGTPTSGKYQEVTFSSIPSDESIELLKQFGDFTISSTETKVDVDLYAQIKNQLELLLDRNEYSVKYITSGGYPSAFKPLSGVDYVTDMCYTKMLEVAKTRGDAVALIDYQLDEQSSFFGEGSIYSALNASTSLFSEFGAAMYPWAEYYCGRSLAKYVEENKTAKTDVIMPPSFGYMMCVAHAIKTSPNWLAMAGVTRGLVPNIKRLITKETLTNTVAEDMQPKYGNENSKISINCITNIRPYGLTLWGNRTLKEVDTTGAVATNFLNIRNMVSDIKKLLYSTAKSLMFEQDSDSLWLRFKSGVSPLLNQLKSGNGISDFKIIKNKTRYNGDALTKGEISATIRIFPLYAIEYFELTVEINDTDVSVS